MSACMRRCVNRKDTMSALPVTMPAMTHPDRSVLLGKAAEAPALTVSSSLLLQGCSKVMWLDHCSRRGKGQGRSQWPPELNLVPSICLDFSALKS
jgi:hypothetical protein